VFGPKKHGRDTTLEESNETIFEDTSLKAVKLRFYENDTFSRLDIKPTRYTSRQFINFFHTLMELKIKFYEIKGKNKILKTAQLCFSLNRGKTEKNDNYFQVLMHPFFFCQTMPYTFYYKGSLTRRYHLAGFASGKVDVWSPVPYYLNRIRLFLRILIF